MDKTRRINAFDLSDIYKFFGLSVDFITIDFAGILQKCNSTVWGYSVKFW